MKKLITICLYWFCIIIIIRTDGVIPITKDITFINIVNLDQAIKQKKLENEKARLLINELDIKAKNNIYNFMNNNPELENSRLPDIDTIKHETPKEIKDGFLYRLRVILENKKRKNNDRELY